MKENFVKLTTIEGGIVFVNLFNVAYVESTNGYYILYFCVTGKSGCGLCKLSVRDFPVDLIRG